MVGFVDSAAEDLARGNKAEHATVTRGSVIASLSPDAQRQIREQVSSELFPVARYSLPYPPSVNAMFRNVSAKERAIAKAQGRKLPGRLLSKKYLAWKGEAGLCVMTQRIGQQRIPGRYKLEIVAGRRKGDDLDNLIKATSDLMVSMNVIDDDSLAEEIVLRRGDVKGCVVTLRAIGGT